MSDEKKAAQATPNATLEQQVMSACIAKSEREWWAKHRIDALAAELAKLKATNAALLEKDKFQCEELGRLSLKASAVEGKQEVRKLEAELATVKAELDSIKNCRDHQATMLNEYVAQVDHWKAEAVWSASFIVSLFKAAWEADQSSTYQRAQAILKEAEI